MSVSPYYDHGGVTIYHGDCRDVLPCVDADVLITDPPYGVNLGNHASASEHRRGLLSKQYGYLDTPENFDEIVVPAIQLALKMTIRGMVFCVPPSMWRLPAPDAIGGIFVAGAVGRNRWGWSNLIHCLLYGAAPNLEKGAKQTAISKTATAEKTGHPTTKPLPWLNWAVSLGASSLDVVCDPFMGSGTTLLAAKNYGLRAIGVDVDEKYCEIAANRLRQEVLPL